MLCVSRRPEKNIKNQNLNLKKYINFVKQFFISIFKEILTKNHNIFLFGTVFNFELKHVEYSIHAVEFSIVTSTWKIPLSLVSLSQTSLGLLFICFLNVIFLYLIDVDKECLKEFGMYYSSSFPRKSVYTRFFICFLVLYIILLVIACREKRTN